MQTLIVSIEFLEAREASNELQVVPNYNSMFLVESNETKRLTCKQFRFVKPVTICQVFEKNAPQENH